MMVDLTNEEIEHVIDLVLLKRYSMPVADPVDMGVLAKMVTAQKASKIPGFVDKKYIKPV